MAKDYTWDGRYDYEECVKDDVTDYIECNINFADYEDLESLEEDLNERLWAEDSVTGNGSGSYTFSRYEAEENLCHNLDLLGEALDEYGYGPEFLRDNGPEACDVVIRCYLLGSVISDVLEDMEADFEATHETEENIESEVA